MIVKLLTEYHLEFLSLKGCCAGWSESTLVKMPHCWKPYATAQNFLFNIRNEMDFQYPSIVFLGVDEYALKSNDVYIQLRANSYKGIAQKIIESITHYLT